MSKKKKTGLFKLSVDDIVDEKRSQRVFKELEKEDKEIIRRAKKRFAENEATEAKDIKKFSNVSAFIRGIAKRDAVKKEINRRLELVKERQRISLGQRKPILVSSEDINKPILPINADDIFKQL